MRCVIDTTDIVCYNELSMVLGKLIIFIKSIELIKIRTNFYGYFSRTNDRTIECML